MGDKVSPFSLIVWHFFRGDEQFWLTTLTSAKNVGNINFNRGTIICPALAFQPWLNPPFTPQWDGVQQQQQHKKLGIIIHYLDQFNHNRSLHTPRAQGQTALQSEPLERVTLLPGLSPGYIWLCSHTTIVSRYTLSYNNWGESICHRRQRCRRPCCCLCQPPLSSRRCCPQGWPALPSRSPWSLGWR